MRKASDQLRKAFFDGMKQDVAMGKHSTRLAGVLAANNGEVKSTIVQLVMAPTLQSGLMWAANHDILQRSLEGLVLRFKDSDFDDVPGIVEVANWRKQLAAERASKPRSVA